MFCDGPSSYDSVMFILLVVLSAVFGSPPSASGQMAQPPPIPGNISVDAKFRSLLETMFARSPTFRRQCARIESERGLAVGVRHVPAPLEGGARGITYISRSAGGEIVAEVTFGRLDDAIEIVAHEFEHIIERLDNIDLATKARRAQSGVHAVNLGRFVMFETRRALKVGRQVAEEVRQKPRERSESS